MATGGGSAFTFWLDAGEGGVLARGAAGRAFVKGTIRNRSSLGVTLRSAGLNPGALTRTVTGWFDRGKAMRAGRALISRPSMSTVACVGGCQVTSTVTDLGEDSAGIA